MSNTPLLNIVEVAQSQSNKEVTINDALRALENATQANRSAVITAATTLTTDQFTDYFKHIFTGSFGATTLTVPNTPRLFYVQNNTNGDLTVRTGSYAVTSVVPTGEGRLLYNDGSDEISEVSGGGSGTGSTKIALYLSGQGVDENLLYTYMVTENCELSATFSDCQGYCATPPGSSSFDVSIDIQVNGVEVGRATFQDSINDATFVNDSGVVISLTPGDRVSFQCPASFESMAGISITLLAAAA